MSISQAPPVMTMAPVTTTPLPQQQLLTTQHPDPLAPMSSIMDKDARKRKQVSGSRATKPSLRF